MTHKQDLEYTIRNRNGNVVAMSEPTSMPRAFREAFEKCFPDYHAEKWTSNNKEEDFTHTVTLGNGDDTFYMICRTYGENERIEDPLMPTFHRCKAIVYEIDEELKNLEDTETTIYYRMYRESIKKSVQDRIKKLEEETNEWFKNAMNNIKEFKKGDLL